MRSLLAALLVLHGVSAIAENAPAGANAALPRCTWEGVGAKYQLNPALLYAIAKTESGLKPWAKNVNKDGSIDHGMMQINSRWLPTLAKHGITERDLYDPCVSLDVGAWVLHHNMKRLGNSWNAVGAYNAASPDKRLKYALLVYRNIPPSFRQ